MLAVGLLHWMLAPSAQAQTVEVTPFVGYRFGGDLYEMATATPLDGDGAPVIGGMVDVFVQRRTSFSFIYSHQETQVDIADAWGTSVGTTRLSVDHWHVGGTQEFDEGGVKPFLSGSLGLTRFGSASESEMRFSMAGGGGVKLMPSRYVGARLDGRVYAVFADGDSTGSICTPGTCLVGLRVSVVWQAEFTAGIVVAF